MDPVIGIVADVTILLWLGILILVPLAILTLAVSEWRRSSREDR